MDKRDEGHLEMAMEKSIWIWQIVNSSIYATFAEEEHNYFKHLTTKTKTYEGGCTVNIIKNGKSTYTFTTTKLKSVCNQMAEDMAT